MPTGLAYADLLCSLNARVREHRGPIRGCRFTLDVERAADLAELEAVARRFVDEVRRSHGAAAARQAHQALQPHG